MEIISSGIITVPAGVSSTGLYFIQEGVLQVVDKGWAQEIGLAEGGQAFVSSGGILYLCTVSSGGTVTVLSGGYAQDVTVENGGLYLVSSGGTAHKSLLKSGGTQIVRAGEMAASVTVMEGGVLHVSSGGYARNPVVSSGGFAYAWPNAPIDNAKVSGTLEVNANAAANSVSVLDGGKLAVLTGGYAYEAKISSGGTLDIASGGRANFTKIYESGTVMVSAGASCNNAEINGGTVTLAGAVVPDDPEGAIIPGGFASKTTVNSGGFLFISSGGVANSTTVNSRGSMYVSSGGVANSTTVNSGGYLDVSSGGVASCAIVSEWGMMAVNKDGLADGTTVESDGRLYVSNGGTVSNATVESAGILYVSRGGTASGATVNSGGSMFVSSGGTATGLAADSGACLNFYVAPGTYIAGTYNGSDFVIEDGAVSDYTVNGNVKLFVSSGCTADVITVNSKGELRIRGGAAANGVTVNGGDLYVQNSGTATDIVWTPCEGHVYVYAEGYATFVNEYSGVYFGSGNKLLSSASPMDGKTLDADFEMYVMGGGAADNTTVNSGGMLYVQNGGAADHATVNSGGSMYISSGGIADSAAVNEGGRLYVSAGGTATGAAVNSGGSMYISSGGTAAGATVNSSGELIVYSGGTATGAAVNSDGNLKVYFGGTADHAAVNEGGRLYVSADGTATGAAVNSDGELIVYSDGTAAGATVNDEGCLYVSAGGTATGVTVNSGGSMYISSGGTAAGTTVNSKGLIYVCNGGIATNILENGGYVYVGIDEDVTFLPNTIEDLVLEKASATLHSGTTASIATVNKDGTLQVCGGLADRVTLNDGGDMFVGSGGTAADITVYAGGRLELGFGGTVQSAVISSGGIVTGYVDCQGITFDPSATLQFDLSVISPGNESALVNLAGIAETPDCPSFTLLVSDSQDYGDYKLAENAWGFETKTISVSNSVMEFGALSLDRSVVVGSRKYTLNLNDGDLILSVNAAQPTQYVYLDFDGENLVRYNNSDLELSFDLSVADPAFSGEQRAAVVSALSERYGKYNIAFALERPEDIEYSTLYFGVSSAFDEYGDFFGISETCDGNDQVRDDNAFVLVNSGYSDDQIITVASHMLDRLMGFSWSGSVDGSPAILKYAESKALLSLSAGWNQKDPYNKYCPIDPNTGDRCVVGCTNTAASQIIYYWIENGLLDFTLTLMDSDAYQSNDYIMIESSDNPESGHLSFA
ncbi:MAG: AIDA repeat-containing protein, partial [Lentisphaeria bacterium]|nr:AIDA repeat-containing protein [Lentisphaeria bacterium]